MVLTEEFLKHLKGVQRHDNYWTAFCPAHDNKNTQALSVSGNCDKVLVKCHTGCSPEEIVESLGLTINDLFYHPANGSNGNNGGSSNTPLTLAAFGAAKGLELAFLEGFGIREEKNVLIFKYALQNGQRAQRHRLRLALTGNNRFRWNKTSGQLVPYGLWLIKGWLEQGSDYLILVEGESDALTLWRHNIPALGIPGADQAATLRALHVSRFRHVYIVHENDREGGDKFENGLISQLANLEYQGKVHVLDMAKANVKDVNDIHLKGTFDVTWAELITQARDIELPVAGLEVLTVSDIVETKVEWLWDNRIPLGKLVLFVGGAGLGKSFTTIDIAARLSNGRSFPDGAPASHICDTLIFSAEDGVSDTIKPRCIAQGADGSRIHVARRWRHIDESGNVSKRVFSLTHDLPGLEKQLDQNPRIKLVVIDPVSAYMAKVDSHKNSEVRSDVLDPLAEMAERRNITVLAVTHFNKTGNSDGLERVSGSIAFPAAARAVWGFVRDPEDLDKAMMVFGKNNLGPRVCGLAYRVTQEGDQRAQLQWLTQEITEDLNGMLAREQETRRNTERAKPAIEDAKQFLREMLQGPAPVKANDILAEAERRGISTPTLSRARKDLQIKPYRQGGIAEKGVWMCAPLYPDKVNEIEKSPL